MYRKFDRVVDEENENLEMNISDELKKSILNDPQTASIYTKELEENNSLLFSQDFSNQSKSFTTEMVYLDLNKALKSNQSKHNLVLHEGDSIVIPKTMDVVHITGELMNLEGNSISAPFFNSKRANYYVKNFAWFV